MTNLCEGDRVAAVRFALDEGLRIWPIFGEDGKPTDAWRVVQVAGQSDADITELYRGSSHQCQEKYPDARFGINDNETVPPGTLGTVDHVSNVQAHVAWDNGARLAFTDRDEYRVTARSRALPSTDNR
jgi:hypothetical protein